MKISIDPASIVKEFKDFEDYTSKMKFSSKWPEQIKFVEGDQWPAATEKTKYMPRPVINQCDFIVENKKSNILSQSLKMIFSPDEIPEGQDTTNLTTQAENYTDAADTTWHDLDQDTLNEDYVDDALVLGTGVLHYFFDNTIKGGQFTPYVGKIQGEIIDPKDVALGNPQLRPYQKEKQPYIIIRGREDATVLQEIAKKQGIDSELILPDDPNDVIQYNNEQNTLDTKKNVTWYIKYYRENNEMKWVMVTSKATIKKARPLSPQGSKPFTIYPVEMLIFKKRRKCTFGRSILEDIIPNQKALNWGLGMMLLSVQQTAWPKIIAKVGALIGTLTNEPGEIVTDYYAQPGIDGIKYMQPPNFSQMPMLLTEKLLDMTRQVTGSTEVTSGEVIGANMAASAIIALQNQAKKPIEAYQNKLFRSIKNIGRIWEEFYKCYFNMPRPIKSKDDQGNEITKTFTGTESADTNFGLRVDVGPASVFSESLQVTVLEKLFEKGALDKYQYVKYLPKNVVSQELTHDFEKEYEKIQEQQAIMQQQQQAQSQILDKAMQQLTPEEALHLQENPQLKQVAMQQAGMGGEINGMPGVQR